MSITNHQEPHGSTTGKQAYHVSWLAHDVTTWRTDEVYVDAEQGPIVATRIMDADGTMSERPIWRRLEEGKAVVALLDQALDGKAPSVVSPPSPGR